MISHIVSGIFIVSGVFLPFQSKIPENIKGKKTIIQEATCEVIAKSIAEYDK